VSNTSQRRTVYYSGRVQGVGFRDTTSVISRGHQVSGYVRNLPDGRVEMVAEGTPAELEAFFRELREQMSHHIRDERCEVGGATGEFSGFGVRH
jgi:acylphosphatase